MWICLWDQDILSYADMDICRSIDGSLTRGDMLISCKYGGRGE